MMAGGQPKKETLACGVCKSGPLELVTYITHIMAKRHQKNLKNRRQQSKKNEMKRTLHVTGYKQETTVETIIATFFKYEVLNVTTHQNYCFMELKNNECVKNCLADTHFIGKQKLKVNRRHQSQATEPVRIKISWPLKNALKQNAETPERQWHTLNMLIQEIELKVYDYQRREMLRSTMEDFLRPDFPQATAHVFGSSANNLGFEGCDVDLYVYLGVDPWEAGTKAQMESKARDLTWYLARKLKSYNRGYNVQAIAKARVPIVKFTDPMSNLHVDLSFRNGMPVYNTQLICQYTRAHMLVRPYLMIIRYWAKIQEVAGGGQPTYLITNYGLTMLMLFYLMVRDEQILPSVAELKSQCPPNIRNQHMINGWDCCFGQDVSMWANKRHNATVLELVCEFFTFYGELDASAWVISPLTGQLLDKNVLKQRDRDRLPRCLMFYCSQDTELQIDTALCLQDPFEHCYNVTRGLHAGPLAEFQYKCRVAANNAKDIMNGQRPLGILFEEIEVDESKLDNLLPEDSTPPKEVDISQEEIITLDDSDVLSQDEISQDEIEVLDIKDSQDEPVSASSSSSRFRLLSALEKGNEKGNKKVDDLINIKDGQELNCDSSVIEIVNEDTSDSSVEEIPNGESGVLEVKENGISSDMQKKNSNPVNYPETMPEDKLFKFNLDFSKCKEFTLTFDGSISGGKGLMVSEDDIGQAACSLIHFILQQCLKMDTSQLESASQGGKRKSESPESVERSKRMKNEEGDSVSVVSKYRKVAEYRCTSETQLWIGRRKLSKAIPSKPNDNPLQFELSVTEAQMAAGTLSAGKLELVITVWQETKVPHAILVTGDSLSSAKSTKGLMAPLFTFLPAMTQSLLQKIGVYIVKTSSKR